MHVKYSIYREKGPTACFFYTISIFIEDLNSPTHNDSYALRIGVSVMELQERSHILSLNLIQKAEVGWLPHGQKITPKTIIYDYMYVELTSQ